MAEFFLKLTDQLIQINTRFAMQEDHTKLAIYWEII